MSIRLWNMGSLEHKIFPTKEAIEKFKDTLKDNNDGTTDIVWGPEVSCQLIEEKNKHHEFVTWLSGFLEISDAKTISEKQLTIIRSKLDELNGVKKHFKVHNVWGHGEPNKNCNIYLKPEDLGIDIEKEKKKMKEEEERKLKEEYDRALSNMRPPYVWGGTSSDWSNDVKPYQRDDS